MSTVSATGKARTHHSESYVDMFSATLSRNGDRPALSFPGRSLTYRQLYEGASNRAAQLSGIGLGRGDRFGLMLPNSQEFVELFLGGAFIGAVPVPINTRYKPQELRHLCIDAGLTALFITDSMDEHVDLTQIVNSTIRGLEQADAYALELDDFPDLRAVALLGRRRSPGMLDQEALENGAVAPYECAPAGPDDPLVIMYTSGTTSAAKGCVTGSGSLAANARAAAARFELVPTDRWWDPLPMFHMGALLLMSAVFAAGSEFISMDHFDPDVALDLLQATRPTILYPLFPTITLTLMHAEEFSKYDHSCVRAVCNVSPPDIQAAVQDAFAPATLISAYGMTELCGTLSYSRLDDTPEKRLTTCGLPLPGWEARIVDTETGAALPPGERGELLARGECLFEGYFANPEVTAASIDTEGFFHTGDLCSIDEDGYLLFHGRLKDVLKVGGENVSALEVESFLSTHPAVKLAQVVGLPDDRLGEIPAAFIELVPGQSANPDEIIRFCTGAIASFKVPRHVRFVTEWPMSSTKIQKFRLRDQLMSEMEL